MLTKFDNVILQFKIKFEKNRELSRNDFDNICYSTLTLTF